VTGLWERRQSMARFLEDVQNWSVSYYEVPVFLSLLFLASLFV